MRATRSDLVALEWFPSEIAAHAAAAALESAGIECAIERDQSTAAAGMFGAPVAARLLVAPQALNAAREILDDWQKAHAERSASRKTGFTRRGARDVSTVDFR